MIPAKPHIRKTGRHVPAWQTEMARAFTRPADLLAFLELPADLPASGGAPLKDFPMRVPRGFAARMAKGNTRDPLFLQVWPAAAELQTTAGFVVDAVGDLASARGGGLIHKYCGRALVIATGACAVNCRYCFRRHFPYAEQLASRDHWREALAAIAADPSIEEVILSGGDPLSLTDDKLGEFDEALAFMPHVRRLRLHTRLPIVLPERVDAGLLRWLSRGRLHKVVVVHANHPNELDGSVEAALAALRGTGVQLLNQSVLLRGVNDLATTLAMLSKRLFELGVLPYYLHMLDRVLGTAHFDVDEDRAHALMSDLSACLPGYLVPKLVREEAGAPAKTLLA